MDYTKSQKKITDKCIGRNKMDYTNLQEKNIDKMCQQKKGNKIYCINKKILNIILIFFKNIGVFYQSDRMKHIQKMDDSININGQNIISI